jgi:hypothetical protein
MYNFRNKAECPLNNKYLTKNIIYQATVNSDNATHQYIGASENEFKTRYRNHLTSFRHSKYMNSTELSKHIWELKAANINYTIRWKIISRATPYSSVSKRCNLCLTELFYILYKPKMCNLNQKKDLILACRHKHKHLLSGVK